MKTKLLKRLRSEAHKEYYLRASNNDFGDVFYEVCLRHHSNGSIDNKIYTILGSATNGLRIQRRRYIRKRLSEIRTKHYNRKLKKI